MNFNYTASNKNTVRSLPTLLKVRVETKYAYNEIRQEQ